MPATWTSGNHNTWNGCLSDDLNTQNRWYSNASQIDSRQKKKLCDNAKSQTVSVFKDIGTSLAKQRVAR
ncbi:hypothetical protein I3J27_22305 [Bradyrhizobium xenonodulans]|uniref:Uncharacterized protein n=1 Tax=Bradyrhizobium xenonodulans TaxID=2736875 RepID=A0ABY7MCZ6_9BRAD|nr:hypothetical protein [Bradyrhizobium xenonodulans]WBL75766.1 hypothetical protein I3J27_22305 [Bradyrhizobium xenonodulans]